MPQLSSAVSFGFALALRPKSYGLVRFVSHSLKPWDVLPRSAGSRAIKRGDVLVDGERAAGTHLPCRWNCRVQVQSVSPITRSAGPRKALWWIPASECFRRLGGPGKSGIG